VEVGKALLEIRDQRLYRQQHRTFEDYCRERWKWTRQRGYQLMQAASVARNLSTIVDTSAQNEAQARELTRLTPTQQREIAPLIDFKKAARRLVRKSRTNSRGRFKR
jgi:hypothetical protein